MKVWGGNFLLQSSDIDLAREAHEGVGLSLEVAAGQSAAFHCKTRGVIAEDFSIYYKTYGAPTILNAPPASDYWLSIPVAHVSDKTGQSRFALVHRPSRMACPGKTDPLHLPQGAEGLGLRFDQNALALRLSELTGKNVKGTITFDSDYRAESKLGQTIAALAIMAAHSPDDWTPLSNPVFKATFADMLTSFLLINSPHSHVNLLYDYNHSESLAVRTAIDYIHSNLDNPIRLSDLASVSGVPVRTLNYQFNRTTGFSPLGYMRKTRLEAARIRLQKEPQKSITEIAFGLGFTNQGRFAGDYKSSFGETPTQTRKRTNGRLLSKD